MTVSAPASVDTATKKYIPRAPICFPGALQLANWEDMACELLMFRLLIPFLEVHKGDERARTTAASARAGVQVRMR